MSGDGWGALPCGRDPAALLGLVADRVAIAPGAHESRCPYCHAALAELADLWEPVHSWARRDVRPPPGFLRTVVGRIRRIAQSPRHVAAAGARGSTFVTSWVLGLIASSAALGMPGVAAITEGTPQRPARMRRRQEVRYGADGVGITEVGATAVSVSLGVTASGDDLVAVADDLRRGVIDAIARDTTIEVTAVDITIDDITLGEADLGSGATSDWTTGEGASDDLSPP